MTNAAITIARPIPDQSNVLLALSRCSGLPELVMYPKPPITKNPVAIRPARPAMTWMTLRMKFSTWVTFALTAKASEDSTIGDRIATNNITIKLIFRFVIGHELLTTLIYFSLRAL